MPVRANDSGDSATGSSTAAGDSVTVTVAHINPGCATTVTVDGGSFTLPAGVNTYTFTGLSEGSGRHRVSAPPP